MECAARDADGDRNRAALAEVIEWPVVCLENAANARARPTRVGVSEVVGRALDVSPHHGMGERDAYSVVPSGWHGTLIGKPPTGVQKTPMRAQEVAPVANSWEHGLQDPIRRHGRGFDTLDHELDDWLPASGPWSVKDDELFEERVEEGRYSLEQAASIRVAGARVADMLSSGSQWWDESWATWRPPAHWQALDLRNDWQAPAT